MKKYIVIFSVLAGILGLSLLPELLAEGKLGIVKTKFGSVWGVSGQDYKTATIFKGIPYAAPPVGELRWKPPQDPKPWDGIRVCETYANAAWMGSYFKEMLAKPNSTYWQFYAEGVPPMSEDCLYLNVATPAVTGNERLPVMIWFHGGGFAHGWSYEVEFNPEGLANKGVIVVSVGTRLNIFGFLSLPQLSAESSYKGSGNYGLMDCSKAIQWVHDNIQGFGGDPNNITVFGQSGGSGKTTGVLISPLSRNLIKNTINQSALGPFGKYKTLKEGEAAGVAWLKSMGLSENISAAELRKIDARILISGDFDPRTGAFGPIIDGYSLLENPVDFYLGKGNLDGKNMMFGGVFGESEAFKATTAKDLYAELKTKYGDKLFDKYKINDALQLTDANTAYYRYALASDEALMTARVYAEVNTKLNNTCKTFVYRFGHVTPGADWAWHSSELWYTFASLRKGVEYEPHWTFFDDLTAEVLSSYWSNFAKKGDPNDYGLSRWPQGGNLGYMFLDGMSYSKEEPLSPWEKLLREYCIAKNGLEKVLQ